MCYLAQSFGEFDRLIDSGMVIPLVAIVLGCGTGMVAIIATAITRTTTSRHREQTRREIAAYVAEGTISPQDAVVMLNAGKMRPSAPNANVQV
ncbi:MAG: hypothetical protein V3T84_12905 [Phycisphaerales bacterium]